MQPEERLTLASLLQQGWSLRRIVGQLGRSPSTLSREVGRNRCCEGYWSAPAQARCQQRRIDARPLPKLHTDGALWHIVTDFLLRRWSSQQIARTLRRMHPDDFCLHVCHETIYNAIYYAYPHGELRSQLIALLRQGKSTRRPRRPSAALC